MPNEAAIQIKSFQGLNIRDDSNTIKDYELVECVNFDLGRGGELKKRTGFEQLHNGVTLGVNSVKILGHFVTNTISQILVRAGGNLYYSTNGADWILIGAYAVEFGVQYVDKFYMVRRGGTLLQWDGAAIVAIAGSPSGDFCIIHKERLFVLDSAGTGTLNSRLYFSEPGDLSATGWVGANLWDFQPGDGDFLTCCAVVNDILVVFKTKSTWGLYVQESSIVDWVRRNLNPKIGCISKYTPRDIEGQTYFVGINAIYKTNGASFVSISDSIQPYLQDRIVNLTNANIDSAAFWDDKYIVLTQPAPSSYKYLVYYIRSQGWSEWEISGDYKPSTFVEIRSATPGKGLYAGDLKTSGNVFRFGNNVYTDVGNAYLCSLQTKDFDLDLPGSMKRGKWLALHTKGVATLSVSHVVNGVEGSTSNVNSESLSKVQKASGPGYFRQWAFKLSVSSNTSFIFFGLTHYLHRKRTQIGASV